MMSATTSSGSGARPGEKACNISIATPKTARPRITRMTPRSELAAPSSPSTAYAITCSTLSPIDVGGSAPLGTREKMATNVLAA